MALPVLFDAQHQQWISIEKASDDALDVIQHGMQSSAAAAVNKLAVRLAAGNDRLAQLVRNDQDLAADAKAPDKAIVAAVSREQSRRDAAAEQRNRNRMAAIAVERATLQRNVATEFPDYAALSNPLPLVVSAIQALLSDDEAMVLFSVVDKESYAFAVSRQSFDWRRVPLGAQALSQKVAAFRRGLDVDRIANAGEASTHPALFDLALANELYNVLLGPVETLVKDKRSLIVVPSGALTALPFHLLVTEKPANAIPATFDGYREAAWLLKRQAPSIASLKMSRVFAHKEPCIKPMTGFGDPQTSALPRPIFISALMPAKRPSSARRSPITVLFILPPMVSLSVT